uniref:Ig-like domain-containing protein n=1 Tax=Romanomermis culicivorax TaxID=13658 RepID=A0A915J541_ROMCU
QHFAVGINTVIIRQLLSIRYLLSTLIREISCEKIAYATAILMITVFSDLEKIELKPSFIMVTRGQPVALTCVISSNFESGRSIFWFRNDQMVPSAMNKSSLELKTTELKDTGSYRCEITSSYKDKKIQSNAASIVVREMFDSAEKFYQSMKSFSTPQKTLVTFGQDGIEFYDQTDNCTLLKLIPAYLPVTKFKSGFLCGPKKV